jgi:sortase B
MISKIEKIVRIIDRALGHLVIVFFTIILLISAYAIFDAICIRNEARVVAGASELVNGVADDSRISELKKTNSEIVAWISLDDTEIDYPILQSNDNQFYLNHDYRKDYSIAGSIFADYRSDLLRDDYAVIYGHNMDGKAMFGRVNDYESADFFSSHKTGRLYLEDGRVRELAVLAYAHVENDSQLEYNLTDYANDANDIILERFKQNAINSDFTKKYDHLMMISTCYQHSSQRAVLLVGYNR